jgi:acyl-CoA dehydrogenase
MSWEFETDEVFQAELDWIDAFVRTEVEPVDQLVSDPYDVGDLLRNELIRPLQRAVKQRGLWACHLSPRLGGRGYGQLKLALMNEILGRSSSGPIVFGCQAPDSGNAEILAHFGTEDLKHRYLEPLLDGAIVSCFSMTEPQGGTDPTQFRTRAELDGDHWVVNGEKWFSSNARYAAFLIVMVVTDPDAPPHRRLSALVVPADTPGVEIVRNVGAPGEPVGEGTHAYIRYHDVHVPADHMLGQPGEGFLVAQTRLGGGRIHHAMRTVARVRWAFDAMCQRALSRTTTRGERLADQQMVQEMIADSWIEIEQFRLLVLRTAWKIDRYEDYQLVRADISAVKAAMPKVYHDVAARALQLHGSIGVSNEMPFGDMVIDSFRMGLADGATEIHKVTLARQILGRYEPTEDLFPSYHVPRARHEARERLGEVLERAERTDAAERARP